MRVLLIALVALVGCAEQPLTMHYIAEGNGESFVWPQPPDVPRYQYIGQLTGEDNFRLPSDQRRGSMDRLFRWVVGLGKEKTDPLVLQRPQSGMVAAGRIYITDIGRKAVFVFDEVQGKLQVWDRTDQHTGFAAPIGICLGPDSEIWVADAELGRIIRLDMKGNPLGSFGDGVVSRPTGLARDPLNKRVYVADSAAHDIKVFFESGEFEKTIGWRGTGSGQFNGPTHLWFEAGKLYVSDTLNARVQVLDQSEGLANSVGSRGLYVGNLIRPKGVASDSDGNIYVVEGYYDHLLVFDPTGHLLLPLGGTGSQVGQFFLPTGVWVDRDRIFVADMFNGRVMIFQYLGS